jgi:ferredoxin
MLYRSAMSQFAERKIEDLTIRIDREACSALEACIREAPGVFRMGDDNVVTFTEHPEGTRERVIEACRACPVSALTVLDKDGNRLV